MSNRRRLGRPPRRVTGCPACGGAREIINWRGERRVTYVHKPGCAGVFGTRVRSV